MIRGICVLLNAKTVMLHQLPQVPKRHNNEKKPSIHNFCIEQYPPRLLIFMQGRHERALGTRWAAVATLSTST
jgi:hypothetical protein